MKLYNTKKWKIRTSKVPNITQINYIETIQNIMPIKQSYIKILADFCDVDFQGCWIQAYQKVINHLQTKGPAHTLELYQLRYGNKIGLQKFNSVNSKKTNTQESFINRYGELKGKEKYSTFCINNKGNKTLQRFVTKYGEIEGHIKYTELRNREKQRNTKKYYTDKYGEDKGSIIYNKIRDAITYGGSREGYISKYGEIEGLKRIKEVKNTVSLASFKKRHGDKIGLFKYNNFIATKKINNTKETYILKYGSENGIKRYNKWRYSSAICTSGYSKISQELFNLIDTASDKTTFYATKNAEFMIKSKSGMYFFDYVDSLRKKVIEFHGDIFHGNPTIYQEDDTPNPFNRLLTCRDMWEYDNIKQESIKELGYNIHIVWEKDYRTNKAYEINKCKQFLGI
jgi:hypothetical protein